MEKIVHLEQTRTSRWFRRFRVLIGLILVLLIAFLLQAWAVVVERHTLDLLALLAQDREIIEEFWQDTVGIFIEELPQKTLVVAGMCFLILLFVVVATRRKRTILRKKLTQLATRGKISNNRTKE